MAGGAATLTWVTIAVHLEDAASIADFTTFLERAANATDGVVRLTAEGGILRATVCAFAPFGLLDTAPTVLGMRTFRETSGVTCDAVLSGRALLDRLAHLAPGELSVPLPPTRETATWVGVEPPRDEWRHTSQLSCQQLRDVALQGIAEVAEALPDNPGEIVVRDVRAAVWSQPIGDAELLPRSVAFTAHMLGFLPQTAEARVFESGRWLRLSTPNGHVLVYRR